MAKRDNGNGVAVAEELRTADSSSGDWAGESDPALIPSIGELVRHSPDPEKSIERVTCFDRDGREFSVSVPAGPDDDAEFKRGVVKLAQLKMTALRGRQYLPPGADKAKRERKLGAVVRGSMAARCFAGDRYPVA